MKKLLVVFASVMMAGGIAQADLKKAQSFGDKVSESYKKEHVVPGTIFGGPAVVAGNAIEYTAKATEVLANGGKELVDALIASGKCANQGGHPGQISACAVDLGGAWVAVAVRTTANGLAVSVSLVEELSVEILEVVENFFQKACVETIKAPWNAPCVGIVFVIDTTQKVISAVAAITVDSINTAGSAGAAAAVSFFDVGASMLRLDLTGSALAAMQTGAYGACAAGNVGPFLIMKLVYAGLTLGQGKLDTNCNDDIKSGMTRESFKAGKGVTAPGAGEIDQRYLP